MTANEEQGKCGEEEDEQKPPASSLSQTGPWIGAGDALPAFSAPTGNPSTSGGGCGGGFVNPDVGGVACAVGSNVSSEQTSRDAEGAAVGGRMEAVSASDTAPVGDAERNAGFDDEAKRPRETGGASVLSSPSAEPGGSVPASIAGEHGSSVVDDSRMPGALGADGDDLAGTAAAAVPCIPPESRIGTTGDVYPEPHTAGEGFKNTQGVENTTGTTTGPAHDDDSAEANPINSETVTSAECAAEGTGGEVSNLSDFTGGWVVSDALGSTAATGVVDTAATSSSSSVAIVPDVAAMGENGVSARGAGGSTGRVGEENHPAHAPDEIQDGTVMDAVNDPVMESDAVSIAAT